MLDESQGTKTSISVSAYGIPSIRGKVQMLYVHSIDNYKATSTMSHLFGDEDDNNDNGLDHDDAENNDEEEEDDDDVLDMEGTTMNTQVGALLMRFCPHDSSMLYPQVRVKCIF